MWIIYVTFQDYDHRNISKKFHTIALHAKGTSV